jgi:[protein-PII] uridylyltransferase
VKQSVRDTRFDFFFRTSLLDARYLCGKRELFDELMRACKGNRALRDTRRFFLDLEAHIEKRHRRFGDASYTLEPDIKEGTGSLRDYHCLLWVTGVASLDGSTGGQALDLARVDHDELEDAAGNLLSIRYALHELAGRKVDRLSFEYQQTLADRLGFKGNGNETASELLMRSFHCSALAIKSITGSFRAQLGVEFKTRWRTRPRPLGKDFLVSANLISFSHPDEVARRPGLVMDAFGLVADQGLSLSYHARNIVRRSLETVESLRLDNGAKQGFIRILRGRHCLAALTTMLETGILERFLPEFAPLKGRTQVDVYHTFTTDLHSIRTVHELRVLEEEESEVFGLIEDKEALYLAALLHDIGKGYGRPHAVIGASMVHDIAVWLGFPGNSADLAAFLVHHHLLLPDIAYRRDLSEEKVSLECARIARDGQTLAMLYLLSIADSRATGPRAWDDWKASLLQELFQKAMNSLQRGVLRDPQTMIVLNARWGELIGDIPSESRTYGGGRLWVLPQAYVIHTEADHIRRHLSLGSSLKGQDDIALVIMNNGGHTKVTMITRDRPGLFALLTGILTINHLDILSSQVFTWLDGVAVDTFHVLTPWEDFSGWERIRGQFKAACSGAMDLGAAVAETRPLRTGLAIRSTSRPSVSLDNVFSDFFTLIEVHAPRSSGLLYRIARCISALKLDIHRAFLSHTGDPCTDVFYVVDEFGEKIVEPARVHTVEDEIIRAIGQSCS